MGHRELISSLREKGEETMLQMSREAEEKASRIRAEAATRREAMKAGHEDSLKREVHRLASGVMADAGKKGRRIRLEAQQRLSDRLLGLARSMLADDRKNDHGRIFVLLAGEAPPGRWKTVRVNPLDRERAAEAFPGTDIVCSDGMAGGYLLLSEDGDIQFDNTLEKRLEKAWPELFSLMILKEDVLSWKS